MAWAETYLDLAAGSNGSGTSGSPWNSWANAQTGLGTIAVPTRLNVTGNVTLGASVTFAPAGTAITLPLWVRGTNAAWADIGDAQTGKPTVTQSTFTFTCTSGYTVFSGIEWTGSPTTSLVTTSTGTNMWFHRCRFTNTSSNTSAFGMSSSATNIFTQCKVVAPTTASYSIITGSSTLMYGCTVRGSLTQGIRAGQNSMIIRCVVDGAVGMGISANGSGILVDKCSIYGTGGAASKYGIDFGTNLACMAVNNVISGFSGTSSAAIFSSAVSGLNAKLFNNRWWNCTSGIVGLTEAFQYGGGVLGSDPFTNASGDDFTPAASIYGSGLPGLFEGESYTSYPDSGALQRQVGAGGGVGRTPSFRTTGN